MSKLYEMVHEYILNNDPQKMNLYYICLSSIYFESVIDTN